MSMLNNFKSTSTRGMCFILVVSDIIYGYIVNDIIYGNQAPVQKQEQVQSDIVLMLFLNAF